RAEHLLMAGIVDNADCQLAGDLKSNRYAVERAIVDVVGSAVERIHDPGRRSAGPWPAPGGAFLLPAETVARKAFGQIGLKGTLRAEVGVGHQVKATLLANLEARAPFFQHGRPAPGGLACGFEAFLKVNLRHSRSLRRTRASRRAAGLHM